jgi:DegV family protein with EDD domain
MPPQILTDSTADLNQELLDRFSIKVIPLWVTIHGQTYQDGVGIDNHLIFKWVDEFKELPKTSAPSVLAYTNFFNQSGDNLHFSISSKLYSSYQNALLAANSLDQPTTQVIDTLNLSAGIGLLAVKAAELRDQGLPAQEIVERIKQDIPRVRTAFIIDTLEYLYMGGRCSAIQSIFSSLLKIRPVIEVKNDGTLGVKAKTRGSRAKSLGLLIADFEMNLGSIDLHRVFITHTGCIEDAIFIRDGLLKFCTPEELIITTAGSVVASHCGPNTIGILYLLKA